MTFIKVQDDHRLLNTTHVVDLTFNPDGLAEKSPATGHKGADRLDIALSNGTNISIEGDEARGLWEAFQTVLQTPPPQPDWLLQRLVNLVNRSSMSMGITLQVSGLLVSGELIGGRAYFDGIAEELSSGLQAIGLDGEDIKKSFAQVRDEYYPEKEGGNRSTGPTFIHLKNVRFFHPAGTPLPANRPVWWRGRLSEVGGFNLGSLSSS